MNILPHKSWHVYNKKNIEKVRKDEAKAAIEEKEKQKRVLLAENEFRLDILRKRAEQRSANEDVKDSGSTLSNEVSICVKSEPLNLFTQEELFGGKNKEYELEKKKKEIALEKQYTMYLDKDTSEESMPWYVKKSHKEKYKDQYKWKNNKHGDKARKRGIIELKDDPLQFINGIMEKSRQNEEYIPKKHKSSKRKSREESSSPSIEELRRQRRERERDERERSEKLFIARGYMDEVKQEEPSGYYSQYNREETYKAKHSRRG